MMMGDDHQAAGSTASSLPLTTEERLLYEGMLKRLVAAGGGGGAAAATTTTTTPPVVAAAAASSSSTSAVVADCIIVNYYEAKKATSNVRDAYHATLAAFKAHAKSLQDQLGLADCDMLSSTGNNTTAKRESAGLLDYSDDLKRKISELTSFLGVFESAFSGDRNDFGVTFSRSVRRKAMVQVLTSIRQSSTEKYTKKRQYVREKRAAQVPSYSCF